VRSIEIATGRAEGATSIGTCRAVEMTSARERSISFAPGRWDGSTRWELIASSRDSRCFWQAGQPAT